MSDNEGGSHAQLHDSVHDQMKQLYDDVFWCFFAGCYGLGVTHCGDPCCLQQLKVLCLEDSTQSTDCCGEEGCIFGVNKVCCLTGLASFPPGSKGKWGIPMFACCNHRCGGGEVEEEEVDEDTATLKKIAEDTFLCYFCLCSGAGVMFGGDAPCVFGDSKFFCLRSHFKTGECNDPDTGCCYLHEKLCCLIDAETFPPGGGRHDGIPMCACCGKKCGGEDEDGDDEEKEPVQETMG